jgi:CheY-like chemotaxis protein
MLDSVISRGISHASSSDDIVDVNQILTQTLSLFRYQMKARGILLDTSFAEGALPVRGDTFLLQQVFYIVFLNCVQFLIDSKEAKKMRLSSRSDGDIIMIDISADAAGLIMLKEQDPLKQFFATIEKGMGLGWYTLQKNIMGLGGRVTASGAFTFTIELPCAVFGSVPDKGADSRPSIGAPSAQRRVLIIDDEVMTGKVTAEMMEHLGFEAVYADDPMSALPLLKERRFDLVMVDYLMPKMNGIAFIREHASLLKDSCVVLMTGDSSLEDSRITNTCKVGLLKKPFGFKELTCLAEKTKA